MLRDIILLMLCTELKGEGFGMGSLVVNAEDKCFHDYGYYFSRDEIKKKLFELFEARCVFMDNKNEGGVLVTITESGLECLKQNKFFEKIAELFPR